MSRAGARGQRKEQKRLRRAVRRTNKLPKGLPGSGSKKHVKRFWPQNVTDMTDYKDGGDDL